MGCDSNILHLAWSLELVAERDDGAVVHWAPKSTWDAASGARIVRTWGQIESATDTAQVKLVAQTSVDGKTWFDVFQPDGTTIANLLGDTLTRGGEEITHAFLPDSIAWGPYVRFGVEISATTGDDGQPFARVSIAAEPLRCGPVSATPDSVSTAAISNGSWAIITGASAAIPTMNLDSATFFGSVSFGSATSVDIGLEGAPSATSGPWTPFAYTTVTTSGSSAFAVVAEGLPPYVRLAGNANNSGATASGSLIVRARN